MCDKLKEILADNARILVPTKNITLRIVGFDSSVNKKDIEEAIIINSGCKADEIEMGEIIRMRNGLYTVWIKCSIAGANKMIEDKYINIGWTSARIEIGQNNMVQCYKCWHYGHVSSICKSGIDRKDICYKCGSKGHLAKNCENPPWCIVCEENKLEAKHKMGSYKCESAKIKRKYVGDSLDKEGNLKYNKNGNQK